MSSYFGRRKTVDQIRFTLIALCIIGAIIMVFAGCTTPFLSHPPTVKPDTIFRYRTDTVKVIHTDTVTRTIQLPPVVVHDTVHTVTTDTVQVKTIITIRDTLQLHDTVTVVREKRDTLVLRDTLTLRDTVVRTVFDTITKHDSTFVSVPVHDTVTKVNTIHDTTKVTVFVPVHDTTIVRDSLHPRLILPVDTVFMRAGDPPISLQYGDTVKIPIRVLPKCSCSTPIDTVEHTLTQGLSVAEAGVDTIGMHIYDWPTRVGDNDVYLGSKLVGRLLQGSSPSEWFVYRSVAGQMEMPRDTNPYPSKLEAMKALLPSS